MSAASRKPRLTARRRRGLQLLLDDLRDAAEARYAKRLPRNLHIRLDHRERALVREALSFVRELCAWHDAKGETGERITQSGDSKTGVGI